MNTSSKRKSNKYFGELEFAVISHTILCEEEFYQLLRDDVAEATITLKTPCGQVCEIEVLDFVANWSKWEGN